MLSNFRPLFLSLCLATSSFAYAGTPDCKFPSRSTEPFVWVNAGNGGYWAKWIEHVGPREGYFRFVYYAKNGLAKKPAKSNRLFVEAWQRKEVGHDLFVGCIEVTDELIALASGVSNFVFEPATAPENAPHLHDYSVQLNMMIYQTRSAPPIQHKVNVPLLFINHVS